MIVIKVEYKEALEDIGSKINGWKDIGLAVFGQIVLYESFAFIFNVYGSIVNGIRGDMLAEFAALWLLLRHFYLFSHKANDVFEWFLE